MQTSLLHNQDIAPDEWDAFVHQSPQGNIYHLHTYLSNLLPGWQAVMLRDGERILAAFPFASRSKWGEEYALQPFFAQYLGILFSEKSDSVQKRLEFEKKAIQLIHEALPKRLRLLSLNFAPEFDYDLPLIWLGWKPKMLYTYWVDIRQGYGVFLQSCASHVRREVKKAESAGLTVRCENNPELVVEILKTAKPEALRQIPQRSFDALCQNARHYFALGKSCCLIGYQGEVPIAGIIYFFHQQKMIYYQGSTLPEFKNTGIMSKIIAESVRLYGEKYHFLDFDGSMIEPIERFFRGFGAYPVRYCNFTLNRLRGLPRLAYFLKNTLR